MDYLKHSNGYLLRFTKGELLIQGLSDIAESHKLKTAWFSGIGAAQGAELGFYDLQKQQYNWQTFTKLSEITNLTGNITQKDNRPVVHAHITLSDEHCKTFGGHLKELVVGGTVEINVSLINKSVIRSFDEETGLNLIEI